jgi:hypothetical protein
MKKIAYITWGCSSQVRSFQDFSKYLDNMLYLRELEKHDLTRYAAIVIPDGMNRAGIRRYASQLNDYVRAGGFLIAFLCPDIHEWIDVVELDWKPIDTRDWLWWTKPEQYLEIYQPEPKHSLCEVIPLKTMGWHWFGAFGLTDKAQSALNLDDDSASIFLDFRDLEGGGRLIVSTLDPHGHNGERFMPATTKFLEGFYPWLNREVGIDRDKKDFVVTYVQCLDDHPTEWAPPGLAETFSGTRGILRLHPQYQLSEEVFATTDILYLPHIHDQIFLSGLQRLFLRFLERGGHLVLCSETAIRWLPFLEPFQAVPPRPFTNIKVRVRNDPLGFFKNMDRDFDGWSGIFGQYARGWSDMPSGAVWLTDVGTAEDPRPADWLWQYPTDTGKGGKVFMHNGDNMIRYPDHGEHKDCLVRDICVGLIEHSGTITNRF